MNLKISHNKLPIDSSFAKRFGLPYLSAMNDLSSFDVFLVECKLTFRNLFVDLPAFCIACPLFMDRTFVTKSAEFLFRLIQHPNAMIIMCLFSKQCLLQSEIFNNKTKCMQTVGIFYPMEPRDQGPD